MALLETGPGDDAVHAALQQQFRARFVDGSEEISPATGDPFVDAVVAAYRRYWVQGLMDQASVATAERRLRSDLGEVSGERGGTRNLQLLLSDDLAERGVHALLVPAPPLQDLFAWRTERRQRYAVDLADGVREVEVVFMNDFVSLGWKDYASLGLAATTGWVEAGVLYCVEWAYRLDSENFEVSYLKHEARHLADLERFPGMLSVDLEYRAKLTELAYARETLYRVLEDFSVKRAPNPASPHAEANHRVVSDLHGALFEEPPPLGAPDWRRATVTRINRAARGLLETDTRQREMRG